MLEQYRTYQDRHDVAEKKVYTPDGRMLQLEFIGCDADIINDVERVKAIMKTAIKEAGSTFIKSTFHNFHPQGISGTAILEESHMTIHTWPETGHVSVNFYTCGDGEPKNGIPALLQGFGAKDFKCLAIATGKDLKVSDWQIVQPALKSHLS